MDLQKNNLIKSPAILFIMAIYIICLIVLMALGITGDNNPDNIKLAMKYFTAKDITTGFNYFTLGVSFHTAYRIIMILVLFLFIIKGYHSRLAEKIGKKIKNADLTNFIMILCLFLFIEIIQLPFSFITDFYRNKIFGLMKSEFHIWLLRYLSSAGISIFIMAKSLAIIIAIIHRARLYLLYVPVVFIILSLSFSVLYPNFITPLYYKTTGLEDQQLKTGVNNLLKKADIKVADIRVINKSKYSTNVNAYVTGFGDNRMVYLYDTVLQNFNHDEILSIVAHELCHYKEEHIIIGSLLGGIGIFFGLIILNLICKLLFQKDIKSIIRSQGIPHLYFLFILVMFISTPILTVISRVMETRADKYSLDVTGKPESFISVEVRISKNNRSRILVNPVYTAYYSTHPSVLERIKNAEGYMKRE